MRIWVTSDASRSRPAALFRAAFAVDQLFRSGRAGAVRSRGDREFLLSDGSGDIAVAAGGAGDRRDRDREPGGDHRSVFADPSGRAAWPAAALRGPLHLRVARRTDLFAAREPAVADRRLAAGPAVPYLKRIGLRLWHRGFHNHGGRWHHGFRRDLEAVELA